MKTIHNEIFYATGNKNKFEVARDLLAALCPTITLTQLAFDFAERQTSDQAAISREKALAAWRMVHAPVLADDAGVYFDAYPGFPGFMTKYVWQSLGEDGIFKLLEDNHSVSTKLFLTYCNGPNQVHEFIGATHGILKRPEEPLAASCNKPFNFMMVIEGYDRAFSYRMHTKNIISPQWVRKICTMVSTNPS